MPNWIPCKMTIAAASNDEAGDIYNAITNDEDELDFERIVPPPNDEEYLHTGWHDWNIEHWGTKWNADKQVCTEPLASGLRAFSFKFDTAWAAPFKIIQAIATRFPGALVMLHYRDPGCPVATEGVLVWRNGQEVSHETRNVMMLPCWLDAASATEYLDAQGENTRME